MQVEKRLRLAAEGAVTAGGEIEILAITAGEGNGWEFPAGCLRESLGLWDGVETYVDHAWLGRSVRDLPGGDVAQPGAVGFIVKEVHFAGYAAVDVQLNNVGYYWPPVDPATLEQCVWDGTLTWDMGYWR